MPDDSTNRRTMQTRKTTNLARRPWLVGLASLALTLGCLRTRTPSVATNSPAPQFSLPDSTGKQVSLAELTANGPAIVTFYRGYW